MPLTVVAIITAKPGSEETVKAALTDLTLASRQDQGCISYDLKRGTADPAVFVTVEEWESQGDLDAHMSSPALAAAVTAAGSHMAKPFEIITTAAIEV